MKIAVLGAGVVGVTTAYELAAANHHVTVFDRFNSVAEASSFATGGVLTAGDACPWLGPQLPALMLKQMWRRPQRLRVHLTQLNWQWLKAWREACLPDAYLALRQEIQELTLYSHRCRQHVSEQYGMTHDRSPGVLRVWRQSKIWENVLANLDLSHPHALPVQSLSAEGCRLFEPAMQTQREFGGGLYFAQDEAANCRQFTQMLKEQCVGLGVVFKFDHNVTNIRTGNKVQLTSSQSSEIFDAVVVCAGMDTARWCKNWGLKLPLMPLYGYTISAPIREPVLAPRSCIIDEEHRVSISRLGQRIRISGAYELGGSPLKHRQSATEGLYRILQTWFPSSIQGQNQQVWKGGTLITPDNKPIVGHSGLPGVWLNVAHGDRGWTQASGCARLLASQISGLTPEIDPHPYQATRFTVTP